MEKEDMEAHYKETIRTLKEVCELKTIAYQTLRESFTLQNACAARDSLPKDWAGIQIYCATIGYFNSKS